MSRSAAPSMMPAKHGPGMAPGSPSEFWVGTILTRCIAPHPRLSRALRGVGAWAAWVCSRPLRQATQRNAARLLGSEASAGARRRLARRVIASHYDLIADVARASRSSQQELEARIGRVHGEEHYDSARRQRCGIVMVTAHLGSFEVGAAGLCRKEPHVHVVFKRDPWAAFEDARRRCRTILGVIEAPIDDGLPTWLAVRAALSRSEVVLMQGDLAAAGQDTARVPFLGGSAELPTGPMKLAQLTGALVLPVFAPRGVDGKVDLYIEPAIKVSSVLDVPKAVAALAEVMERHIRRHPEQWLMTRPACVEDRPAPRTKTPRTS